MNWNELLLDLLFGVITVALPIVVAALCKYLGQLFDKIGIEIDHLVVKNTINQVLELILKVVQSTSQTYVDSLKASGEFNEEAKKKAFNDTKETILALLNEESKEIIQTLYGDIEAWLNVQIEAAVKESKKTSTT